MKRLIAAILFAATSFASQASTQVLTFDSLSASTGSAIQLVPDLYGGLDWSNFAVATTSRPHPSGTQAALSLVTSTGALKSPVSFSSLSAFNLDSAYFTAAWFRGLTVAVDGFVGTSSTAAYHTSFTIGTTSSLKEIFNWTNLTKVVFATSGGTAVGTSSSRGFYMDNLSISTPLPPPVPEPETLTMMVAGLALMGTIGRRRLNHRT